MVNAHKIIKYYSNTQVNTECNLAAQKPVSLQVDSEIITGRCYYCWNSAHIIFPGNVANIDIDNCQWEISQLNLHVTRKESTL